jgi:signal transduction histidine kinase
VTVRPVLAWAALGVAIASQALALVEFWVLFPTGTFPPGQRLELATYAICSAAASAGMLVVRRRPFLLVLLAARAAFLLLLMAFVAPYRGVTAALVCAAALEAGVYEPFPRGLVAGASLSVLSAVPALALHAPLAAAEAVLLGGATAALASFMTRHRERLIGAAAENARLDAAVGQLSQANLGYQSYAQSAEQRSTLSERQRVTREIHDVVGYTLTNSIMMMEAATDMVRKDPEQVGKLIETARRNAEAGLQDVRRALRALRAQDIEAERGLRAIVKLVHLFELASGVEVQCELGNLPWSLGDDVDEALYHFVQEGLVNAFRHGKASQVRVMFWIQDGELRATIRDNGRGAVDAVDGIGLAGMRERLSALGGTLSAGNAAGGFQVAAAIPVAFGAGGGGD